MEDFALFADDKKQLWAWKRAIVERLAGLRLTIHESAAQVQPVASGIPWLGFVVFPTHIRLKGRKVGVARRRLAERFAAWRAGDISFAELDASVKAWVAHARHADSWGLRRALLSQFPLGRE